MQNLLVVILMGVVVLCNGAVLQTSPLSKLVSGDGSKQSEAVKDLETSASDRSFLLGKDYGYGSGYGSGYGYGNYPGINSYNRGYYPNSVYRGYQTGLSGILGGGSGWGGYYGNGYGGLGTNYYGGSYGNGVGGYGYGLDDGLLGHRGYNRWNSLDGTGYGYGTYGGYGNYGGYAGAGYPHYGNRGYGSYGNVGYPSGYRGYS